MTNKLPVLQNTENEVFMELQQIGVTPVIKRYCVICKYSTNSYRDKIKYPASNRCSIYGGRDCYNVNPKFDCKHWTEEVRKGSLTILPILLVVIISFIVGAFVF